MAKLVARLLATETLWVQIEASLKNAKWATQAKEWPTYSSPPKKISKKISLCQPPLSSAVCTKMSPPPMNAAAALLKRTAVPDECGAAGGQPVLKSTSEPPFNLVAFLLCRREGRYPRRNNLQRAIQGPNPHNF